MEPIRKFKVRVFKDRTQAFENYCKINHIDYKPYLIKKLFPNLYKVKTSIVQILNMQDVYKFVEYWEESSKVSLS